MTMQRRNLAFRPNHQATYYFIFFNDWGTEFMPTPIDFELKAALDVAPTLPLGSTDGLDHRALRDSYEAAGRASRTPHSALLVVDDHRFASHGGRSVALRLYRPQRERGANARPAMIYLHGGGWVVGSIETHDAIAAALATRAGVVVASIEYSLAPEYPYPAAVEDVEAAMAWLTEHADAFGLDPKRIAIGGDSAGANLAASACIRARDAGDAHRFAAQMLIYPVMDCDASRASIRDNADAPVLSAALLRWFIDRYVGKVADDPTWRDPSAFPMHAESLAGLPQAFVVTAGHDPLCDEGIAYAARLVRERVNVTVRHAPDLTHGFMRYRAASRRANQEFDATCAWLAATLGEN